MMWQLQYRGIFLSIRYIILLLVFHLAVSSLGNKQNCLMISISLMLRYFELHSVSLRDEWDMRYL